MPKVSGWLKKTFINPTIQASDFTIFRSTQQTVLRLTLEHKRYFLRAISQDKAKYSFKPVLMTSIEDINATPTCIYCKF